MCKQAFVFVLLIVGLIFLLLCFVPTWLICLLGVMLIVAGIALFFFKIKRGR